METLKEELEEMSIIIKGDLKEETKDKYVNEVTEKIKELERQIVSIVASHDQ